MPSIVFEEIDLKYHDECLCSFLSELQRQTRNRGALVCRATVPLPAAEDAEPQEVSIGLYEVYIMNVWF